MNIILNIVLLVAGFALLIIGANVFVDSSVNIAKKLKVPSVIIGLTIVAFGTSAPEAVVSLTAAIGGSNDLAVGNVVGSNIFNLLFIIGVCALVKPIAVVFKNIKRDYWVSVGAGVLLIVFTLVFKDTIPRIVSLALLAVFVVYMVVLVRQALKDKAQAESEPELKKEKKSKPIPLTILLIFVSLGLIVGGGQLTVSSAVEIALTIGITERVIGLTIVAVGTSLPELVTSLVASKKGENDIILGNIIGSNIFNILFILGLSGVILPITVDSNMLFDLGVLTIGGLVFLAFALTGKRIGRFEGIGLVAMYAAYTIYIL